MRGRRLSFKFVTFSFRRGKEDSFRFLSMLSHVSPQNELLSPLTGKVVWKTLRLFTEAGFSLSFLVFQLYVYESVRDCIGVCVRL